MMFAFIVVRQPVAKEPLEEADRFCFQCAVINPDQENLELSDIVRTQCSFLAVVVDFGAHFLQWAATKINKQPLFYQYLPVAVISSKGLTPKEEAIRAQQGIYDRLMKEDTEESAKGSKGNRLGQFAANVGESSAAEPEKFSKVQEASVSPELYHLASRRLSLYRSLTRMSALADSKVATFNPQTMLILPPAAV